MAGRASKLLGSYIAMSLELLLLIWRLLHVVPVYTSVHIITLIRKQVITKKALHRSLQEPSRELPQQSPELVESTSAAGVQGTAGQLWQGQEGEEEAPVKKCSIV